MSGPHEHASAYQYGSGGNEQTDNEKRFAKGDQEYDSNCPSRVLGKIVKKGLDMVHIVGLALVVVLWLTVKWGQDAARV